MFKLKEVRLSCHLTQEELAKKSGVSRATISGLENGTLTTTTTSTLVKLASAMGKNVSEIFLL